MLQVQIHRQQAAVLFRVVDTHVRGPQMVVLNLDRGVGHGVARLREIDRRREIPDLDRPRHRGLAVLPRDLKHGCGRTRRSRHHTREDGVEQAHVHILDTGLGIVTSRRGGVIAAYDVVARRTVVYQYAHTLALEVPPRIELQRRHGYAIYRDIVQTYVRSELAAIQCRLHRGGTVAAPLNVVTHAHGESGQRRYVEIVQPQRKRIRAAARGHAVDMQHLVVGADHEVVDHHACRIDRYLVGGDTPVLAALRNCRRQYRHGHTAHSCRVAPHTRPE